MWSTLAAGLGINTFLPNDSAALKGIPSQSLITYLQHIIMNGVCLFINLIAPAVSENLCLRVQACSLGPAELQKKKTVAAVERSSELLNDTVFGLNTSTRAQPI